MNGLIQIPRTGRIGTLAKKATSPDNLVSYCLDKDSHPAQSYHISWLVATGAWTGIGEQDRPV